MCWQYLSLFLLYLYIYVYIRIIYLPERQSYKERRESKFLDTVLFSPNGCSSCSKELYLWLGLHFRLLCAIVCVCVVFCFVFKFEKQNAREGETERALVSDGSLCRMALMLGADHGDWQPSTWAIACSRI